VSVQEQGDWAEVSIFERYENNTDSDQEIFYSFSLPESAVITGLWLGDDLQPQTRYPFVVSPRGAAQKVYNEEVERGQRQPATDPALLEQVGPRQYRLRVFPIPRRNVLEGRPGRTDLWLTYKTLPQEGQWPLPQLTEKRSIYWDRKTVHLRGKTAIKLDKETWFEASLPAQAPKKQEHQIVFPEGYQVSAKPLTSTPKPLQQQRLALVLDTSYSMASQTQALTEALRQVQTIAAANTLDWYLTAAAGGTAQRLDQTSTQAIDPQKLTFFGSLQLSELLQQFEQLQGSQTYDAVILITDQGSYELAQDETKVPTPTAPLWVLHVGGQLPSAYEDTVLQAIQGSRGGVATDAGDLLQQLALSRQDRTVASVVDGYVWRVEPVSPTPNETTTDGKADVANADFTALAARQLILKLSREDNIEQIEQLDRVHAIAKRAKIVTPYSSMLVLVDERQRQALRQAEQSAERFKRQVEQGNDALTQPTNLLSNPASAPEPGIVLGLGGVAVALLSLSRRRV
ncbi:MAG TPA: TIGR02921 family PEP-CTERM protein, partial [Leptolyngbyaceae cyanobacterium]